jgi:uncharacterized protein
MRPKLALLLVIASFVPLVARADDASKTAKIHELFKVARIDQLADLTRKQILSQSKSGMLQKTLGVNLTAAQQQQLDAFDDRLSAIISTALSWEKLEPEYTKLYADAYTEQQIDDLIAFYKSPTGQVLVEKTPLLMQQANAVSQQHIATVIPQIQQALRDFQGAATVTGPQD